ncbi:MAG: hypothetical protein KNU04_gp27 [crAssphage sp. isolate ctbg_1]|uniref:Uncharacterized protein n=1 Tax=crAssphage sp. isolate ctbg_1 TaxID=2989854 RepID=A0A345MT30_9CAUD|nr:MAG: hypothetical protein KNU04_gp27 [crAssphage sp. isolate ctbg_1]AXH74530.1 MAG: hypothetical protein [crAssphage sp. isolate ctbg_1]
MVSSKLLNINICSRRSISTFNYILIKFKTIYNNLLFLTFNITIRTSFPITKINYCIVHWRISVRNIQNNLFFFHIILYSIIRFKITFKKTNFSL